MSDIFLILAMITDTFLVSLSYASEKIRIPPLSAVIMSFVSTAVLTLSLCFSQTICLFVPEGYCKAAGSVILIIIGVVQICSNRLKALLKKHSGNKSVKFSCFDIDFIIKVYIDETQADTDKSKVLSSKESVALALALSVDSLCGGVAAGISGSNIVWTAIMSFILGIIAVVAGKKAGKSDIFQRFDMSWVSGVFLIILAVLKQF